MGVKRYTNLVGFDDAPFNTQVKGRVHIVGVVYADLRMDGVLMGDVEKDGDDSAQTLIKLISTSRFNDHIQLLMLQGVAFGGFNVVDVFAIHEALKIPVLIVSRRNPDMAAIESALLNHIPNGEKKWKILARLGPMEPLKNVYVQRVGLTLDASEEILNRFCLNSHLPEPIRIAHLIGGAMMKGQSRGNP